MNQISKGKCPMCGTDVQVPSNTEIGDLVFCDQCDAELEVVNLKPLELDWPLDDYEEDFEGDDEGYDYDDEYEYEYDDDDEGDN